MSGKVDSQAGGAPQDSPFDFGGPPSASGQARAASAARGGEGAGGQGLASPSMFAAPGQAELGPDYSRRRSLGRGRDEVSVYNDQMRERYAMDPRRRTLIVVAVTAVVLVPVCLVLPSHILTQNSSLALASQSFLARIGSLGQLFSDSAAGASTRILLWQALAVALAGAGLALNGSIYQGTLKNALASPSTLGVMSGATLGNVFYLLLFAMPASAGSPGALPRYATAGELESRIEALDPLGYFLESQSRVLCCLAGCAVVIALVLLVAYIAGRGKVSKVGLLITGQVFTAIIASVIEMVRFYIRDYGTEGDMAMLQHMMTGSFADIWNVMQVALLGVPVILAIAITIALRNRLNLLAFDDDEAKSMGLRVNATRNAVIIVCTVLTAVIVSFVGAVGFVGFVVPHLARKMVGPDFRYYVPVSACLGAAYLLVAYALMNMLDIFSGSVGTFTSIIGAVFFVVAAVRERARGNADWI